MSDPFNMENVAAMAGLPQQGHNSVPALPNTRREMTDTVRIMPRQPIEAKRDEFGEGYYVERGTSIILRDYLNSGGVGWVEVSDPIVWDGTDAMIAEVAAALPSPWECHKAFLLHHHLRIQLVNDFADLNVWVEPGWRIRIEGDSFVILPPKGGE